MNNSYSPNIERREEVRHELRSPHLKSPAFALSESLRNVESWEDAEVRLERAEGDLHVSLLTG